MVLFAMDPGMGTWWSIFFARLAISSSSSRMWVDVLPKFLDPFVKADISSLE